MVLLEVPFLKDAISLVHHHLRSLFVLPVPNLGQGGRNVESGRRG